MQQHQPTTQASASSPSKAPVCPFCGHRLDLVWQGTFCFWKPCDCEGAKAAEQAQAVKAAQEHAIEMALARERRYRRAGIPERWYTELKSPYDAGARSICAAVEQGTGTWLIGDVGLGKTRAVMGAAMAFVDRRSITVGSGTSAVTVEGAKVRCITEEDILEAAGSVFSKKASFEDFVKDMSTCDLLVIDDLGKAKPSTWNVSKLFSVIDGRYSAKKPLVVTSQYGPSDLIARLSQEGEAKTAKALVSRLCSMCDRKQLQGQDHRLEVC